MQYPVVQCSAVPFVHYTMCSGTSLSLGRCFMTPNLEALLVAAYGPRGTTWNHVARGQGAGHRAGAQGHVQGPGGQGQGQGARGPGLRGQGQG